MPLKPFRRHLTSCKKTSRADILTCQCPIHVEGQLGGKFVRRATHMTDWIGAVTLVAQWERDGYIAAKETVAPEPEKPEGKTVDEGIAAYIENCRARRISQASVRKFEILLGKMGEFLAKKKVTAIAKVSPDHMDSFFNSWVWSGRTAQKHVERLRQFWRFAFRRRWTPFDPAEDLKAPTPKPKEIHPLTDSEKLRIVAEASKWPRHYAMVMLLMHAGLRIADAVTLRKDSVRDGKLMIYAAKNGNPVWLPLPDGLIRALDSLDTPSSQFYFWRGEGKKATAVNNWRQTLSDLFKRAGVKRAHPHLFRHTLATDLLESGTDSETGAAILGNTVAIFNAHYAQWTEKRQARINDAMRKVQELAQPKLSRVK